MEQTKELFTIEVQRYIGTKAVRFCDTLKNAYATAIYLKTLDGERKSRVNLILSKVMEFMALLVGIRCLRYKQFYNKTATD